MKMENKGKIPESTMSTFVNGLRLAYYSMNPLNIYVGKPVLNPIVLCHGMMTTKDVWEPVIRKLAFATKRCVYAVDLRNHGESPFADNHTITLVANDLSQFLKEMQMDQVVLFGQGFGALSVMKLASIKPHVVEKFVAIDSLSRGIPGLSMTATRRILMWMRMAAELSNDEDSLEERRRWLRSNIKSQVRDQKLLSFLVSKLVMGDDRDFKLRLNIPVIEELLMATNQIGIKPRTNFDGDALFIHSRPMKRLRREYRILRSAFPKSRSVFLEGRHLVQTENVDKFVSVVSGFINGNDETGRLRL